MRSSIIAIALILAVALPAQAERRTATSIQERAKVKKAKGGTPTFHYGRCRELGWTAHYCGVYLHYWTTAYPNGKVVY